MKQALVKLVGVQRMAADTFLHIYQDPDIAVQARPGQFINVRVSTATAPLLRRPLSICSADPETGEFEVFFKVVGEGTEALARAAKGDWIDVAGPFGTPFQWEGVKKALLIGGGVGVAPLLFLAADIRRARGAGQSVPHVIFAYGARDSGGLALAARAAVVADELLIATEDGSHGQKGFVTEILDPYLREDREAYCCGPTPMMAAVHNMMTDRNLNNGWFSLENQMGCGVGVCQGCVVSTRSGYQRVCCDGPVFAASELNLAAG